MRHRKAGRKLGRNQTHRLALFRNLTMSLIRHERIITTLPKAKAVRPFVEKIITLARKNTLHARRLVSARLGPMSDAVVKPPEGEDQVGDQRTIIQKLFSDIAPRYIDRPGGYTRILKRHEVRLGDAGATAFLELLKAGEVRVRSKPAHAPAPAPTVEAPAPGETPAPANQPTGDQPTGDQPAASPDASSPPAPTGDAPAPDKPAGQS